MIIQCINLLYSSLFSSSSQNTHTDKMAQVLQKSFNASMAGSHVSTSGLAHVEGGAEGTLDGASTPPGSGEGVNNGGGNAAAAATVRGGAPSGSQPNSSASLWKSSNL
jgi:hypothetical protein